ncbi:MAG TPA: c-type cytochrome [Polyangiales bacterium]|nr:c-type cytochrome [Polyangiales bacterium]
MSIPRTLSVVFACTILCVVACNDDDNGDSNENESPNTGEKANAPSTFAEQVELGMDVYVDHCAKCHGDAGQGTDKAPRVVGLNEGALPLDPPASRQKRKEQFVTVADVANFVVANMPGDDPGSLSTEEYLAVLAFDLKANGITLDKKLTLDLAETLKIPR